MKLRLLNIDESVIPEWFRSGDKTLKQAVWKLRNILMKRPRLIESTFQNPAELGLEPGEAQALSDARLFTRSARGYIIDQNKWDELLQQLPWPKTGPQVW